MSSIHPKENERAGCKSGCCRAATPSAQAHSADQPSDTRPTSINSTESAEVQCSSGCHVSAEQDIIKFAENDAGNDLESIASGCCRGSSSQVPLIHDNNTIVSAQCGSGDSHDSSFPVAPGPAKEEAARDGCAGVCCSTKPLSVAVEKTRKVNGSDGCCGTVKPEKAQKPIGELEQVTHVLKALSECKDACCSSTKAPTILMDDCCDGKPKPCCNGMPLLMIIY